MTPLEQVAAAINTLAAFCGPRDISALTPTSLRSEIGWDRADVVMFFGGSIPSGADTMADAIRHQVATTTMLIGGQGHTTQSLRHAAQEFMPDANMTDLSEAEIFQLYLHRRHGLSADLLECDSTNCGTNITAALKLLAKHGIAHSSVILIQDATMQRRMSAGLQLADHQIQSLNFAAYQSNVGAADGNLTFVEAPPGMWPLDRFVSMLLGEVARLRDDRNGYGPRGKGWIAHVDIPAEVEAARVLLASSNQWIARMADPRWAGTGP